MGNSTEEVYAQALQFALDAAEQVTRRGDNVTPEKIELWAKRFSNFIFFGFFDSEVKELNHAP